MAQTAVSQQSKSPAECLLKHGTAGTVLLVREADPASLPYRYQSRFHRSHFHH